MLLIRQQQVDDVSLLRSLIDGHHLKAVLYGGIPALAGAQTDDDVYSAVAHTQRLSSTLGSVTDDGYRFSVQDAHISVLVMKNIHSYYNGLFISRAVARALPETSTGTEVCQGETNPSRRF